ncbi:MAG: DUF2304 domain-containing protein [Desulfobulbaceae bacterium]|jgi:hypothetical protein|nr:DUF2304 domain-containing protein [Desulfobulbaceae bacterium]
MTLQHIVLIWALSLIFLVAVLRAVIKGRLRVRYTLLWFGIGIMALLSPLLYALCLYLHETWSFPTPSILLLVFAVVILARICLQLTVVVSVAWRERKNLAQSNALLEQRLEVVENMLRKSDRGVSA